MLDLLVTFVVLVAAAGAAPAPEAQPLLTQQYVLLSPQMQQFQYEPILKLQQPLLQQSLLHQPLLQQISPLGRYLHFFFTYLKLRLISNKCVD